MAEQEEYEFNEYYDRVELRVIVQEMVVYLHVEGDRSFIDYVWGQLPINPPTLKGELLGGKLERRHGEDWVEKERWNASTT